MILITVDTFPWWLILVASLMAEMWLRAQEILFLVGVFEDSYVGEKIYLPEYGWSHPLGCPGGMRGKEKAS